MSIHRLIEFQFHKVRLKGFSKCHPEDKFEFQFHKVRLK